MEQYKKIVRFSPYISSENIGDQIIKEYCNEQLSYMFQDGFFVDVPTRDKLGDLAKRHIVTSDYRFLCGTNLLTSHMKQYKQWNVSLTDRFNIGLYGISRKKLFHKQYVRDYLTKSKIVLMGAGWWQYQDQPDLYTRTVLKAMLDPQYLHSVRDSYTEKQLRSCGILNVVNTACPTMWKFTKEFCKTIPCHKADNVVTTLTNYNVDREQNELLLNILLRQYKNVYVWLQAIEDYEELMTSDYRDKVNVIAPDIRAYDALLKEGNVDYVGTRLHGGIRALNCHRRSIIIAVDNRAVEISKDTGLPVIKRQDIANSLSRHIEEPFETIINLPEDNIVRWKNQFK